MLDAVLDFLSNGLTRASGWEVFFYALAVTHITIAAVTIYLHRCATHRGLDLQSDSRSLFPLLVVDDIGHGHQRMGGDSSQASRQNVKPKKIHTAR